MDASKSLVLSKNMYAITDCSELTSLTVEEVYSRSLLANGGHVFALFDCVSEEYDPSIECYHADYTCYDSWPENTSQIPWVSCATQECMYFLLCVYTWCGCVIYFCICM